MGNVGGKEKNRKNSCKEKSVGGAGNKKLRGRRGKVREIPVRRVVEVMYGVEEKVDRGNLFSLSG